MWKRFIIYERIVSYNFLLNIGFYIANKELLNNIVPNEIEVALFFLSLGIYLGFQLCKFESNRVWKINENKNRQMK